jgi:hypothetical protein
MPGVRQRCAALTTAAWARLRPTGNRVTGYVAVGAVGALIGTSLTVGVGTSGTAPELADIGAWLSSSGRGEIAHAHGLTGDVDGRVVLPAGMAGHPVSVAQDGDTALLLDERSGTVVRIDSSQLTAEQSTDYGAAGLHLVSGGDRAYVVDPVKATVQEIDPVLTTPTGPPVELGAKPGAAVADREGTLWVPLPGTGTVVPFVEGRESTPVKVAEAGHDLVLTLADGRPVVTDRTAAAMKVLTVAGVQDTFELGDAVEGSAPQDILVPTGTDGSTVPVLAAGRGVLVMVDVRGGHLVHARLPVNGDDPRAPHLLGKRVYVPDDSDGGLLVYDTSVAAIAEPVRVSEGASELDLFVRDGLLWVNDEASSAAAVIDTDGKVTRISKYERETPPTRAPAPPNLDDKPGRDSATTRPPAAPGLPTAAAPAAPGSSANPGPALDRPGPGRPGPNPGGPSPDPSAPGQGPGPAEPGPEPGPGQSPDCDVDWVAGCPEPGAPGTPQAQSGAGAIRITFAAASGATPQRYELQGLTPGQTSLPGEIGPDGPFEFEVRGGSCDRQYSFTVVAHYSGGAPSKASEPSAPARPCLAPGAPERLTLTAAPRGHGGTVTWQPPPGAGDSVTYTLNGPGGTVRTTETTYTYANLENSKRYPVSVTASNAAGSGGAATGTLDLTPPVKIKNIAHNSNDTDPLWILANPNPPPSVRVGSIPGLTHPEVTVYCNAKGKQVTHPYTHAVSDVWGRITYRNDSGEDITGYVADIYLDSRLDPEIWDCT